MAASNSQRVAAFLLALTFLLSTIGFTAYVILTLNSEEAGIVEEQTSLDDPATPPEPDTPVEISQLAGPCGSQTIVDQGERELPEVVTAETPIESLNTVEIQEGNGDEVQAGDCVAALYYGTLASDGTTFDGNYDTGTPIEFPLNGVIPGWTEGIPGMKVGGIRRLEIPAAQAYGEAERPGIPADSDLVFEVEILSTRQVQ
jgi:hypothetical protein